MKRVRREEDDETGMILVNVLMFVAIAASLVLLLISHEQLALDRGLRMREASRALAIVRGGELSARVALRRDAERQREQADHGREAWARLSESGAPIEGGRFDLAIADAQGRFNINMVRTGAAAPIVLFRNIAANAGATPEQTVRLIELVVATGPVTDLRPLRMAGVDPAVAARLERLVTALPGETAINLNAADPMLLTILFGDSGVAERLATVRERQGYLTQRDLEAERVTMPRGAGFASDTFWVRTRATIGDTSQQEAALIRRRLTGDGEYDAVPVERWRGAAIPPDAPQFAAPH
ncbi:type II secretion system minor pseudopilin [Stakelama tenebrarum]|uniref:General secretion pathway protein GspK n=1 Tax=Stakelama tenebrarum TaxID=2711215 RepID=A0A6G6Y4C9_9SPHN|nr:type II secretion system protein GspK [Sphingosinithalassobacter tenebrarum]QIG79749.1 general secretion pathway protein GspK [Sphingosinithalassobacter tenebrarum]